MRKINRINNKAILVGILSLIGFCIAVHFTLVDRNIRINGKIINVPISGFYGSYYKNNSVRVNINGEEVYAGSFDKSGYSVGDSIAVCYIPGEYCVVQERVNPNRYFFYLGLESIILILGISLIIAGFMGKGNNSNG